MHTTATDDTTGVGESPAAAADRLLLPPAAADTIASWRENYLTWLWLAVFILTSLLYIWTGQRGVSWQDSGRFQWRVLEFQLTDTSLAISHPLYIVMAQIARYFPTADFAWRLSALSGIGAALAVANLALLGTIISGRKWIGLAAAAGFAVSHAVWWLATIAEVYTWSVAGLTIELLLLLLLVYKPKWQTLLFLALVNGLGLSLHNFALLALPVYLCVAIVLVVRGYLPVWSLLAALLGYLAGAALYLALMANFALQNGVIAAIQDALVAGFGYNFFNTELSQIFTSSYTALVALSFITLTWMLALVGFFAFPRHLGQLLGGAFMAITILHLLFALTYQVVDQFTFLLPSLAMLALAAGAGTRTLTAKSKFWGIIAILALAVSILIPIAVYQFGVDIIHQSGQAPGRPRELPFRDEIRYWLVPWKHDEESAQRFAELALEEAHPNGIIIYDATASYALLVAKEGNDRYEEVYVPTALTTNLPPYADDPEAFWEAVGDHPLYIVTAVPEYASLTLLNDTTNKQAGVLYRLVRKED